jgi:hypothetical protein
LKPRRRARPKRAGRPAPRVHRRVFFAPDPPLRTAAAVQARCPGSAAAVRQAPPVVRSMRRGAGAVLLLLFVLLLLLPVPGGAGTVNADAKAKAKAKAAAKRAFEEEHGTVFDSYGRVMKWGKKVTSMDCRKKKTSDGGYICSVTKSEERKYRTKEETARQRVIKLDRQAEADRAGGDDTKDGEAKKRMKNENRVRCNLYKDWLPQFKGDGSEKKDMFFEYLASNFEDFGGLRTLARQGRKEERKASKLYRHIAKETHPDKLPDGCKTDEMKEMMRDILSKSTSLKECVSDPAQCDGGGGGFHRDF